MEKETKPSSSFMADFLTCARAVCGGTADAPQLCEAGGAGSGGCAGPHCRANAGDTRAKGPRRRRALGRGKQGTGTRGRWPWACRVRSSAHIDLPEEDTVPAEPRHPVSRLLNPCPQPERPRTAQAQLVAAFPLFSPSTVLPSARTWRRFSLSRDALVSAQSRG